MTMTKTPLSRIVKKLVASILFENERTRTATVAALRLGIATETLMTSGEPPIVIDTAWEGTFSCCAILLTMRVWRLAENIAVEPDTTRDVVTRNIVGGRAVGGGGGGEH